MKLDIYKHFFFIGIAGTGMSAIAQYLQAAGKRVSGSDRQFSPGKKLLIQQQFEAMDIHCFEQDGSGINRDIDVVVVSTAIEESNIEYRKAIDLGIPLIKRSELLAIISASKRCIAVGGTAGKSTTTAMIFHIMQHNGFDPSLMTGAGLASLQARNLPGNAWAGQSEWMVIEADESDGSIVNYKPEIAVLLNIDKDHKEEKELMQLFETFKKNTGKRFIVNDNHPLTSLLSQNKRFDFGFSADVGFTGTDFLQKDFSIHFRINDEPFTLSLIGQHNMENALAATAVCAAVGISLVDAACALKSFKGIYRRTQLVGKKRGIFVIDDFAHNPAEVAAAIQACMPVGKRVLAWFQPHGFGPLRFMHEELIAQLTTILRPQDIFFISDVYYAGGTADKNIQSDVVTTALAKAGKKAIYVPDRNKLLQVFPSLSASDVILLMGARDPSLGEFAEGVFCRL